jgi:hypothetical protein
MNTIAIGTILILSFLLNGCESELDRIQKRIKRTEKKERVFAGFMVVLEGMQEDTKVLKARSERIASANYMLARLEEVKEEAKEVGYIKKWELLKKAVLAYRAAAETNNQAYVNDAMRYIEEFGAEKLPE